MLIKYKLKKYALPLSLTSIIVIGIGFTTANILTKKESKNVIFEIDQNTTVPTSFIFKGYKTAAENFNKWHQASKSYNGIDIEVEAAPANEVYNKIYSKAALPSLYLSYSDNAVRFEKLLPESMSDMVVDIGNVINWNQDYLESKSIAIENGTEKFLKREWIEKWKQESTSDNNFISTSKEKMSLDELMSYDEPLFDENNKPLLEPAIAKELINDNGIDQKYDYNHFTPFLDSFIREGMSLDGKMYVAPVGKSLMTGTINKKIVSEVYHMITRDVLDQSLFPMSEYFKPTNTGKAIDSKYIKNNKFDETKYEEWQKENYADRVNDIVGGREELFNKIDFSTIKMNQINELLLLDSNKWKSDQFLDKTIADVVKVIFEPVKTTIKEQPENKKEIYKKFKFIFADIDNVELLTYAYYQLSNALLPDKNEGNNKTDNKFVNSFGFGVDDITGLLYADIASEKEDNNIDLYSYKNSDPYTLYIYRNSKGLKNTLKWFQTANHLSEFNGDSNGGKGGHPGTIFGATRGYGSSYFNKGGIMSYYGSTAGASHWAAKLPNADKGLTTRHLTTATHVNDLLTIGGISKNPDVNSAPAVVQQGPGIAMFKNENNEKNKVAAKFLNYLMMPAPVSRFGITSGYIPSNKYAYDLEGTKGQRAERKGLFLYKGIDNFDKDFGQVYSKGAVSRFIDAMLDEDISLWVQTPSPYGDIMRKGVVGAYFFKFFGTTVSGNWNRFENSEKLLDHFWNEGEKQLNDKISELFGQSANYKWIEKKGIK